MSHPLFLEKLTLHNFRSFREETVTFANPLFLVGQNGSGKSNFVDALAFISECMTSPLQSVIERRGGLGRVGHLSVPTPSSSISFKADFCFGAHGSLRGVYAFSIVPAPDSNYEVTEEQCKIVSEDNEAIWFERNGSKIKSSIAGLNFSVAPTSLAMPLISGVKDFSFAHQGLSTMCVYSIEPDKISATQNQNAELFLRKDASNLVNLLQRLSTEPGQITRIDELLQTIVPNVAPALTRFANGESRLFFEQKWPGMRTMFEAAAMSRGTLSTLGLIVAALQNPAPSVIAIEEPELNIHPGALEAIADIIHIAAERTQVVVTTHSPDLLDTKWIQPENLRVVEWKDGATQVSELGAAPIMALRQHLMGAGELMRANALDAASPDAASPDAAAPDAAAPVFEEALA